MTDGTAAPARTSERSGPVHRRDEIRRLVLDEGLARIDDLARQLGVSVITVHRDLDALEQ